LIRTNRSIDRKTSESRPPTRTVGSGVARTGPSVRGRSVNGPGAAPVPARGNRCELPRDPSRGDSVLGRTHRVSECLNSSQNIACEPHHVSSKNCKLSPGSPQFFFRIKIGRWRIHLRFPYDSIRCAFLLQVLLATLRKCSRSPHDCCCCGITGSTRAAESLECAVLTPENCAR
jgi:hypothetical protein